MAATRARAPSDAAHAQPPRMHGLPPRDLVREHLWIVDKFVARYRSTAPNADLAAAGALGLVEAAARFEPARGLRFSTYAWSWVKGAVLAEVRKSHVVPVAEWTARQDKRQGKGPRVRVVFGALDGDETPEEACEAPSQEQDADRAMRARGVRAACARLSDATARRVALETLDGRTPEQIGEGLGVGDERVRQILREAQAQLAHELWDPTWEDDRMHDDDLTPADIALIQDPAFYRTAQPLVARLAVAVLEARSRAERPPSEDLAAANDELLAAHERHRQAQAAADDARRHGRRLEDRIAVLEAALAAERERSKAARAAGFERLAAAEVRGLLRQAMRALKA